MFILNRDSAELDQLANRRFVIDCPEISLTPSSSSSRRRYTGPGSIIQTEEDQFTVKILCKEVGDPFEEFSKSRTPAGRIIEDSEYYSLSAMDTEGRLWTANRVLSPSTKANPYCLTVSCNVRELMSVYELKSEMTRSSLQIWFPGEIDIPCNTSTEMTISVRRKERDRAYRLNIAILETNEFSIEIKKERNWLQLHATSTSSQITEDVIRAILESLQFVLAWPLEWSIAQLVQGTKQITKMRASLENKPPDRRRPPLSTSDPDKIDHIWNIFDKYLTYL